MAEDTGRRRVHASAVLLDVCACPDVAPLLAHRSVRVVAEASVPFRLDGDTLVVSAEVIQDPNGAAFVVREGLEAAELRSGSRDGDGSLLLAHVLLAHATAIAYVDLVRDGRHAALDLTTEEARRAIHSLVEAFPRVTPEQRREVVRTIVRALRLRDGPALEAADQDDAVERASEALPFALPTAVLLATGGDDRQVIDWATGESRYGVTPLPRPWYTSFASCTASSPTEAAYRAAERERRRLLERALRSGLTAALEDSWSAVRDELAHALRIEDDAGAAIIPMPSGTDAESLALSITAAGGAPITTILVAPLELGSGTGAAAAGRAFSSRSPNRVEVRPGDALPGLDGDVRVVPVEVRDGSGRLRTPDAVEAEIEEHLECIVGEGRRAVLHVVDGSKTGVRLPRPTAVRAWERRFAEGLDVVVDAAQMRVDAQAVARNVAAGHLTIVTGSKFYAGPPFSGALLVPPGLVRRIDWCEPPSGLAAYLDRYATPPTLASLRAVAPEHPNVGLLLRWRAALHEMTSFLSVSPDLRDQILRELAHVVLGVIAESTAIELVPSPYTDEPVQDLRDLDDLPTIFTIRLLRRGVPLTDAELREVQTSLRSDLSELAPPAVDDVGRSVLARRFEFGQPVKLGPEGSGGAALRLAFGAPTLARIVLDHTRGPDWRARLLAEAADVRLALTKVELVLDHILVDAAGSA